MIFLMQICSNGCRKYQNITAEDRESQEINRCHQIYWNRHFCWIYISFHREQLNQANRNRLADILVVMILQVTILANGDQKHNEFTWQCGQPSFHHRYDYANLDDRVKLQPLFPAKWFLFSYLLSHAFPRTIHCTF